jgi:uncharacterized NAD(P)/FAD-binding protein YdhS
MSKAPSAETQLRSVRRVLRQCQEDLIRTKQTAEGYRARSTKAEQEVAEWKQRFDAMLKIVPPTTSGTL